MPTCIVSIIEGDAVHRIECDGQNLSQMLMKLSFAKLRKIYSNLTKFTVPIDTPQKILSDLIVQLVMTSGIRLTEKKWNLLSTGHDDSAVTMTKILSRYSDTIEINEEQAEQHDDQSENDVSDDTNEYETDEEIEREQDNFSLQFLSQLFYDNCRMQQNVREKIQDDM